MPPVADSRRRSTINCSFAKTKYAQRVNDTLRTLWALALAALFVWVFQIGMGGIVLLAFMGSAVTVGMATGSLAPVFASVSRAQRPLKFWSVMAFCGAVVSLNLIRFIWRH